MVRTFFNILYRLFPPAMVSYWKRNDTARARIINREDGSLGMEIEGEKYTYPGFPRAPVLLGSLSKVKHKIRMALNESREAIQEIMDEAKYDMLPPERMVPAVRELWRAFEELENAEVTEDMKGRINLYKVVFCYLLQEDDAYRFRLQWLLERLDMKKMKLTKEDLYFFRGKYFKVDQKKKILGKDFKAYEY